MKTKTTIILVFALLLIGSIYGQERLWNQGELYLKNGEIKKGEISFGHYAKGISFGKGDQQVKFKNEGKGNVEKFRQPEVDHFIINEDDYYTYVPVEGNKKRLFKVLEEGKIMLYHRYIDDGAGPNGRSVFIQEYHIKKEGENVASLIISKRSAKSFRKAARKYFSDCPSVMELVENRTYRKKHIITIVNEYNKCDASN